MDIWYMKIRGHPKPWNTLVYIECMAKIPSWQRPKILIWHDMTMFPSAPQMKRRKTTAQIPRNVASVNDPIMNNRRPGNIIWLYLIWFTSWRHFVVILRSIFLDTPLPAGHWPMTSPWGVTVHLSRQYVVQGVCSILGSLTSLPHRTFFWGEGRVKIHMFTGYIRYIDPKYVDIYWFHIQHVNWLVK